MDWVASSDRNGMVLADGQRVADKYLEAQNMRLRTARGYTSARDLDAYKEGKTDSRKIDMRGKRLEYSCSLGDGYLRRNPGINIRAHRIVKQLRRYDEEIFTRAEADSLPPSTISRSTARTLQGGLFENHPKGTLLSTAQSSISWL